MVKVGLLIGNKGIMSNYFSTVLPRSVFWFLFFPFFVFWFSFFFVFIFFVFVFLFFLFKKKIKMENKKITK